MPDRMFVRFDLLEMTTLVEFVFYCFAGFEPVHPEELAPGFGDDRPVIEDLHSEDTYLRCPPADDCCTGGAVAALVLEIITLLNAAVVVDR